jgi:23S rRNA-/tRNA-specific pseudouridylate synthase
MNSINQFKVKDSIIYEDDYFLIINKPCGLVVHPTLDQSRLNLIDELKNYRKDNYIALIHRLDKDTSGAILFSKDSVANHFLDEGFKKHTITKKYWALVHGNWDVNGSYDCRSKRW